MRPRTTLVSVISWSLITRAARTSSHCGMIAVSCLVFLTLWHVYYCLYWHEVILWPFSWLEPFYCSWWCVFALLKVWLSEVPKLPLNFNYFFLMCVLLICVWYVRFSPAAKCLSNYHAVSMALVNFNYFLYHIEQVKTIFLILEENRRWLSEEMLKGKVR